MCDSYMYTFLPGRNIHVLGRERPLQAGLTDEKLCGAQP